MQALKKIVKQHPQVAFLIGNGPNLAANIMPSWKELLMSAANGAKEFPVDGLSNTEVYDLVELFSKKGTDVKGRVCQSLSIRKSDDLDVHKRLMDLAAENNAPVLTTNFDGAFEESIGCKLHHVTSKGFTRYYPWKAYYGYDQHEQPVDGFGIWKIHGDVRYKDSIRLGLTDYMGSAERARKLIHSGSERLGNDKRKLPWSGHQTWLDIWFHMPLVIFGLGFGSDEVFLRWLLIERRRYRNNQKAPMDVYYVSKGKPAPATTNLMQNLDVKVEVVKEYSAIYG